SMKVIFSMVPSPRRRLEAQRAPPAPMSTVTSLRSAGIRSPGSTRTSRGARNRGYFLLSLPSATTPLPSPRFPAALGSGERSPAPPGLPLLLAQIAPGRIDADVDRLHLVGARLGVAQRVDRGPVDGGDRHDRRVPDRALVLQLDQGELASHVEVVPVRPEEPHQ